MVPESSRFESHLSCLDGELECSQSTRVGLTKVRTWIDGAGCRIMSYMRSFFYLRSSWCSAFHAWHKPKRLCPPGIDLEGPFHPREGWRRHGERAASHAETHQEAYRDDELP